MQALADCTNLNIIIHHRSIDINPIFYQCEDLFNLNSIFPFLFITFAQHR
ncbi:hypothetical protein BpHYR1_010010 [Brachionus plicatilis]|uniref:Uncharacterized protein n=1 Tax=Brachionus plicatilis TaxID=10195 RepID=A0A3M7T731_BRAPC|nr:hypothetical protein BpHYR1_010010 [Brachionus plicatilis]